MIDDKHKLVQKHSEYRLMEVKWFSPYKNMTIFFL